MSTEGRHLLLVWRTRTVYIHSSGPRTTYTATQQSREYGYCFTFEGISTGWGRTTSCCACVAHKTATTFRAPHGCVQVPSAEQTACERHLKYIHAHQTPWPPSAPRNEHCYAPWHARVLTILFPTPVLPAPPPPAASTAGEEAPLASVDSDHITENTGKFTIGGWYILLSKSDDKASGLSCPLVPPCHQACAACVARVTQQMRDERSSGCPCVVYHSQRKMWRGPAEGVRRTGLLRRVPARCLGKSSLRGLSRPVCRYAGVCSLGCPVGSFLQKVGVQGLISGPVLLLLRVCTGTRKGLHDRTRRIRWGALLHSPPIAS